MAWSGDPQAANANCPTGEQWMSADFETGDWLNAGINTVLKASRRLQNVHCVSIGGPDWLNPSIAHI